MAARATRGEKAAIRAQIESELRTGAANEEALRAQLRVVQTTEEVLDGRGSPGLERLLPAMADLDDNAMAAVAERLVRFRETTIATSLEAHKKLLQAYVARKPETTPDDKSGAPEGFTLVTGVLRNTAGRLFRREEKLDPPPLPPRPGPSRPNAAGNLTQGARRHIETLLLRSGDSALDTRLPVIATAAPTLEQLVQWAEKSNVMTAEARQLQAITKQFRYAPDKLLARDVETAFSTQVLHSQNVLQAFKKQLDVEPVGFLHLERLTFAPDGIERGELVHSVPLAPGEEVSLAHKEWAHTTEEFEKIITDSLEEFSEEGVTETSELAQSTSSQNQHSMGFNTSVTASGGYGPVNVTSSVSLDLQTSATETAEFSRNQSISVTRKASSRSKKEHKISFKVVTTSGTEDQTVRKIKNPFPEKATRVDYYQLIRKWEVNVYRYGIRLTYDITIPEPGGDVLSKIQEINSLSAALQQGFGSSESTETWARFDVKPGDITRSNYASIAAAYNATVPAPPLERKDYNYIATHDWKSAEEAEGLQFHVLEVFTEEDYEIDYVALDLDETHYDDEPWQFGTQSVNDFFGISGKRQFVYWTKFLGAAYVEIRLGAHLSDAAYREWQLKAWASMRDAAQSRYYEQRLMLKDKLAQLQEELGAQDALSLRKFEREEVMKGVLRWLFGPDFEFVPQGLSADLYDGGESVRSNKIWKEVLQHGELIKFLHQAIEWENVLYMLYPYFWSHISRWDLKKYLQHPDSMHRSFLKAGSARVVLTIRRGFERDFVSLLETGGFGGLPANHPYMTIVQEMEAFANTNYPGIPPANPEGAAIAEQGVLIGTWHEYTPTSALDISFNETMPTA